MSRTLRRLAHGPCALDRWARRAVGLRRRRARRVDRDVDDRLGLVLAESSGDFTSNRCALAPGRPLTAEPERGGGADREATRTVAARPMSRPAGPSGIAAQPGRWAQPSGASSTLSSSSSSSTRKEGGTFRPGRRSGGSSRDDRDSPGRAGPRQGADIDERAGSDNPAWCGTIHPRMKIAAIVIARPRDRPHRLPVYCIPTSGNPVKAARQAQGRFDLHDHGFP